MPDNFQQTVDLRDKIERSGQAARRAFPPKKTVAPIERIYQEEKTGETDMQKISRPKASGHSDGLIRLAVFVLAIIAVGATVYFLFFRHSDRADIETKSQSWYAVKLVDGTIYYGQIFDAKAEPVTITNVYYNYDQAKLAETAKDQPKTIEETGNIRLVKRGKETQGGDGTILLYHVNILTLEALRPDSKVLKAILEYEK